VMEYHWLSVQLRFLKVAAKALQALKHRIFKSVVEKQFMLVWIGRRI